MFNQAALIAVVARVAGAWRDPDYGPRARAVEVALAEGAPFTEEGLAYAVNLRMHHLTEEALRGWIGARRARAARRVGVVHSAAEPLAELRDCLAVPLTGHALVCVLPESAPGLLRAFLEEVSEAASLQGVAFVDRNEGDASVDALILREGDEAEPEASAWRARAGDGPALMTKTGYGVAVLDGKETEEEREALAEDGLLYDGRGTRSVRLVWAPAGLSPDPYLDAMADFRGVFPAATGLPGTLKMQKAMLDAQRVPNAYGEGLEFLVSKGAPEPQRPGHLRWGEYDSLDTVSAWLRENGSVLECLAARPAVARVLGDGGFGVSPFGEANRPPLTWESGGGDVVAFLANLS